MEKDLKLIKKKYGEKMMHYCRSELSTILEKEDEILILDNGKEKIYLKRYYG